MNVYSIGETCKRRYLSGGIKSLIPKNQEHRRCSLCDASLDYPPPKSYWNSVYIDQGSFVSNILWGIGGFFHVTGALRDAFQKEGIEFDQTVIVEDDRPSKDKKKLPLEQIPQFYWVKLLTNISYHQDFIELYDAQSCLECGRKLSEHQIEPFILDGTHHPNTDFFRDELYGGCLLSTEKGKAFLESYPKTYCRFTQCELRD